MGVGGIRKAGAGSCKTVHFGMSHQLTQVSFKISLKKKKDIFFFYILILKDHKIHIPSKLFCYHNWQFILSKAIIYKYSVSEEIIFDADL